MKNRKLFAILTLVAFMLTMMPVMAFAATSNQVGAWVEDGSAIAGDGSEKAHNALLGLDLPALAENERVYVFTTVAGTNEYYDSVLMFAKTAGAVSYTQNGTGVLYFGEGDAVAKDLALVNALPARLDVKAVLVKDLADSAPYFDSNEPTVENIIAKVGAGETYTYANIAWDNNNTITFGTGQSYDNVINVTGITPEYNGDTKVNANNGVDYYEVTIKVTNGVTAVKGAEVDVVVNKVGASVSKEVVTTNARGIAKFNVFASKAGSYEITLATDNAKDLVICKDGDPADSEYDYDLKFESAAVGSVKAEELTGNFATDEEFTVVLTATDANGNALTGSELKGYLDAGELTRVFQWTEVPANSGFDTEDFFAANDTDAVETGLNDAGQCVLKITPDEEGDYTLKMFNKNTGSGVEYINFSSKEYEDTVSVTVVYKAGTYNLGADVAAPTLICVDANGTKLYGGEGTPKFSFTGAGVYHFEPTDGSMTLETEDKYLGKEITVNVVVDKCFASTTLKIADMPAYLQFTEVTGAVATEVTVPVVSLDINGNVAALGDAATAAVTNVDYVVTSKPAGAVVSVDTAGLDSPLKAFELKGQSAIKVASTKEGTVTVNVIVQTQNGKYLTGIATVNFGEAATPVQTSATLIIGSNIFVANGGVQTAPAAPVIIDGRTYLPIRAVGQAIGANVDYVDGVITLTLGAQKATMVPGSNVMTVGTETVTMDAAPYLAGDGHTMVPVRYAAQAFGYELGTTANADGSVATVTVFK